MLSDAIYKSHCCRDNKCLKDKSATYQYLWEMSDLEGKLQREKIIRMLTDQAFIFHLLMRNEMKVITTWEMVVYWSPSRGKEDVRIPYLSLHFLGSGNVKQDFHMNWTVVLELSGSMTNTSVYTLEDGLRPPFSVLQTYPSLWCQLLYHNLLYSLCSSTASCLRDNSVWCFLKPGKNFSVTLDFSGKCISLVVAWSQSPPWHSS